MGCAFAAKSGIGEGFIPHVHYGTLYKFHIVSRHDGYRADKADPLSFHQETPPGTASIAWDLSYEWNDESWMTERGDRARMGAPLSIYEVHLGSWRRVPEENNRALSYHEIAPWLVEHVRRLGFTHVEFLPLMEQFSARSTDWPITSYFAPASRHGAPQDLMYLIDVLHQNGIGVILNWVPSQFSRDEHALAFFDGTHLYELAETVGGDGLDRNSRAFNYARREVHSFLISSAFYWLEKYHADALRVDAIARMLYPDSSRPQGERIANPPTGHENPEAVNFLRRFNTEVYKHFPEVQTIAAEMPKSGMVSRPVHAGGLGFGYRLDGDWQRDALRYLSCDPIHRKHHHDALTSRSTYAWAENFILPLSHDEVTERTGSPLSRMPGDVWQKFANLRLLYGLMYAQPGKKLLFMGLEFGQWKPWSQETSLDWHLVGQPFHHGLQRWVEDLNQFYRHEAAMHQRDCEPSGFEWVDRHGLEQSTVSWLRWGGNDVILAVFNFTPVPRHNFRVGAPRGEFWREALNSDSTEYGGSGQGNLGGIEAAPFEWHGRPYMLVITLPPLAAVFFKQS